MDPITINLLLTLMRDPNIQYMAHKLNEPGSVNTVQMQESFADAAKEVMQCDHPSGRFRGVDPLYSPWDRQNQYGAEQSEVIKIYFNGVSGLQYQMIVAVMRKENSVRTFVIDEDTLSPYNKGCGLEHWVAGELPETPNSNSQNMKHGWIGIAIQDVTPKLAESLKLKTESGALVAGVLRNGPADIAGLHTGDVLVQIDGKPISGAKSLTNLISAFSPNQKTTFKVLRAEEIIDIEMIISEKPGQDISKE